MLLDAFSLLDVVEIAARPGGSRGRSRRCTSCSSDRYDVDRLLSMITALPRTDRW